jgi:hypothetical protein
MKSSSLLRGYSEENPIEEGKGRGKEEVIMHR